MHPVQRQQSHNAVFQHEEGENVGHHFPDFSHEQLQRSPSYSPTRYKVAYS